MIKFITNISHQLMNERTSQIIDGTKNRQFPL